MTMVLARLQADGKELAVLAREEVQAYIDAAMADIGLAREVVSKRGARI